MNQKQIFLFLAALLIGCSPTDSNQDDNWCNQEVRSQFSQLEEVSTASSWFKVYTVGEGVYAIAEPYNFQEIISYLIIGEEAALLFDTGMGMSSIKTVTGELTSLPVTVLNSHTHYDHIGGNHEFDSVLAMNTGYTLNRSKNGLTHAAVQGEVKPEAFCAEKLPELDTANYKTNPFPISSFIENGSVIDLGNRALTVIAVPGHTPDAIALLDEGSGYLWTGDTFYEAPIWLFDPETDLDQYQKSTQTLANLSTKLKQVFPAHNTPIAMPVRLNELEKGFQQIMDRSKQPSSKEGNIVQYEFEHFSFMIRKDQLEAKGLINQD